MAPGAQSGNIPDEAGIAQLFALAVQYIALAAALQPDKEVYQASLGVVHALLPLPYLRAGLLRAADPETASSHAERRAPSS